MNRCECEHVDHFEMPERPTLHTDYMPVVEDTLAMKTTWGTFHLCRGCVEAGHLQGTVDAVENVSKRLRGGR